MARELSLTLPYIRVPKRLAQIEAFKRELARPRVITKREIIKARQILGIEPPKLHVPRPWRVGLKYRKRKR